MIDAEEHFLCLSAFTKAFVSEVNQMKIRILDRILVAVAGLILLALCAGIVAQVFFGADIIRKASELFSSESGTVRIIIISFAALLLLIGFYCLMVLFRHRSRRDKFILQKMESGDLSISLKALETMVEKCLSQYHEIDAQSVHLENQRDGLLIRIRGTVASGISIPLTVDTLQKQIKQYVVACSGVEVKGIRVEIESSGEEAKDAPFAIDAPAPTPLLHSAEKKKESTEETAAEPGTEKAAAEDTVPADETKEAEDVSSVRSAADAAMEAAENLKKEYEEENEDDRPIHQRLFSTPEEPCIMPLPPEDLNTPAKPDEEPMPDESSDSQPDTEPVVPIPEDEQNKREPGEGHDIT